MGSFATSIFNLLLGWIRSLVSSLWNVINSQEARNGLQWLGDNWLWLVAAIAVVGLVLDYAIWFIRWRPYYVWRSWWRRLTHRSQRKPQVEQAEEAYPPEAYPPEAYYEEEPWQEPEQPTAFYQPQPEVYEAPYEEPWQEPVHPGLTETGLQESLGWPQPDEIQSKAELPVQAAPRQRRSQREQAPLRRMRTGITQMAQRMDFLGLDRADEEEESYTYMAPPPAVDKRQAFHAPVYPTHWQGEEEERG